MNKSKRELERAFKVLRDPDAGEEEWRKAGKTVMVTYMNEITEIAPGDLPFMGFLFAYAGVLAVEKAWRRILGEDAKNVDALASTAAEAVVGISYEIPCEGEGKE